MILLALIPAPLGVEVLHGRQLCPGDVLRSFNQLPYQEVIQPVRILSVVHLMMLHSILGSILSLFSKEEEEPLSLCLSASVERMGW